MITKQFSTQLHPNHIFNVERYVGWGCILNPTISLFLCSLLICYPYILLHVFYSCSFTYFWQQMHAWTEVCHLCSCKFDSTLLSFMSMWVCVGLSLALIYPSLHTHYFSLAWYTFFNLQIVYIYIPFCSLHPLYTVFLIIAEPEPHTKIWIACAGKYFNLLSMHAYHVKQLTSSSGVVSKQHIIKWMGEEHVSLGKQAESQICHKIKIESIASRGSISKHVFPLSHLSRCWYDCMSTLVRLMWQVLASLVPRLAPSQLFVA